MAEDDEIDIVGDFSFNSCFAQNNQGIPSCSDREDTVHPQWFLDSIANNWYDEEKRSNRRNEGSSRRLSGHNSKHKHQNTIQTVWSASEKDLLLIEMSRHGRDIDKISKSLKTKTKAEIQALIEAEHGITLDVTPQGLSKAGEIDNVPTVIQEEIITDVGIPIINMGDVIGAVTTGAPTIPVINKGKISKSNSTDNLDSGFMVRPSEILYEDDLTIASTELITPEKVNVINKINKREKGKQEKKMGNHRRKGYSDKANVRRKSKELVKSLRRIRKDSNVSEENTKSAKMHLVFSSGQALPVSEGEQVIKIEKKKESEGESDIEIDIDSDQEDKTQIKTAVENSHVESDKDDKKVEAVRKFEPMPKRNKKINLGGGGGCTIMHTAAGDMYEVREEPRKEKPPKREAVQLYPCRIYSTDKPAPLEVNMCVSCLVCMDAHAHTSRAEVAGLVGGAWCAPQLRLSTYARVRAASRATHCDIDPVSQAAAAEQLRGAGLAVVGWHHSHPAFAAAPSATDLRSQAALQALPGAAPLVALITSQHWRVGRAASIYRCFRVESGEWIEPDVPAGYALRLHLEPDVTRARLPVLLRELRALSVAAPGDPLRVHVATDVCPHARITYLEKLISSVSHHMQAAGYERDDPLVAELLAGIRDIFR